MQLKRCVADRELTTTKRQMETDANSQQSVIQESRSRITMLENILAKEAVSLISDVDILRSAKKKMPGVKVTAALSSRFGCRENRNIDCVYLQGGPKNWCHFLYALTLSNIDQFSNFFTVRIRRKFTLYNNSLVSLKIPTHLKYVATLRFM